MSTIVRWNPFREMAAMQNTMDRLFDEAWNNKSSNFSGNVLSLDVYEKDDAYHVLADLPGVSEDQINFNLHEGVLTISAEVERQGIEEDTRVLLRERSFGKFGRSVTLPQPVNIDDVEAVFEDGTLKLVLPKTPEAQPHTIPVKRLKNGK